MSTSVLFPVNAEAAKNSCAHHLVISRRRVDELLRRTSRFIILSMMTWKFVPDESQLRVHPTVRSNLFARICANPLMISAAVPLSGCLHTVVQRRRPCLFTERAHTASSSTNGKLMNPTSCPTEFCTNKLVRSADHTCPRLTQSTWSTVSGQSSDLRFMEYSVAGKNPDVHQSVSA
jgi:hypothetical protein